MEDSFRRKKLPAETTTIFARENGDAFLAQLVVYPNICTHKGLLLGADSLNAEVITKIAIDASIPCESSVGLQIIDVQH